MVIRVAQEKTNANLVRPGTSAGQEVRMVPGKGCQRLANWLRLLDRQCGQARAMVTNHFFDLAKDRGFRKGAENGAQKREVSRGVVQYARKRPAPGEVKPGRRVAHLGGIAPQ